MKLGRSFFSIYASIIVLLIGSGWLLDEVWRQYLKQDIESYTGYKKLLEAIVDFSLDSPESEWERIVNGAGEKMQMPIKLTSLDELDELDQGSLADRIKIKSGNTVVHYNDDSVILLHIIGDNNLVVALGPTKMPTRPRIESMIRVVMLGSIGLIILVWLWPISKDLDKLKKAAAAIGHGDLTARTGKPESTMMGSTLSSFNMMAGRIKRLLEAHKELTNAVSHELRTPLARSKFALQIIKGIDDPQKQEKYLNQIQSDIHELEELINEMLVYASFDSDKPKINMAKCSVKTIVQSQIDIHSNFTSSIEVEVHGQDFTIECDSHFIERALSNYITNANKYGGDKIKIEAQRDDTHVILSVHDNGEGVGEDFKIVAFDAFSREDGSRNKETGGFGLGLAIVQRVMEWHNGEAIVGDSPLGGAVFSLKWPIKVEN